MSLINVLGLRRYMKNVATLHSVVFFGFLYIVFIRLCISGLEEDLRFNEVCEIIVNFYGL